jgi:voltage-gated potassium channel
MSHDPPRDRVPGPQERRHAQMRDERWELLGHVQSALEPVMVALGLVFLVLLLIDFADVDLSQTQQRWVDRLTWGIYLAFVVDFLLRFIIAPAKGTFLRQNWLGALSLVLPVLRPLRALRSIRALRAARATRSLSLVRLLGGMNRGMGLLRQITRGRTFAYVSALSVLAVLAGAAGVLFFERGAAGASITTYSAALWWAATLVTTVNSGTEPVTLEGRIIGFVLRLFGISIFGLVTAAITSFFLGRPIPQQENEAPTHSSELTALRQELAALREDLAATRTDQSSNNG